MKGELAVDTIYGFSGIAALFTGVLFFWAAIDLKDFWLGVAAVGTLGASWVCFRQFWRRTHSAT